MTVVFHKETASQSQIILRKTTTFVLIDFNSDPYNSGFSHQSYPERDRGANTHFTLGPQPTNANVAPG